jgi:hypothetical protein
MSKHLAGFINADNTLDAVADAPRLYAESLAGMVAEGMADVIGWREDLPKGRPSGDRAKMLTDVKAAFRDAGRSDRGARDAVTRLTYALAILAANGRRDDETDEAFVTRCAKIRVIANAGDMDAIMKAVKGDVRKPVRRGPKGPGPKAPKAPKTPKAPEAPANTGDAMTATWNNLTAAVDAFRAAVTAHVDGGGKVTKAMAQQGKIRAEGLAEFLATFAA